MLDKSFNAKPQRFKHAVFQLFPDTDRILGATLHRSGKQRFAAIDRGKAGGTEEQIKAQKIIELRAARSKLKLAACGRQAVKQPRQIDFKVGLKSRLGRPSTLGTKRQSRPLVRMP